MSRGSMSQYLMTPRILFMALLSSVLIYAFVGWYLLSFGGFEPAGAEPMMKYVLIGMGVMAVVASYVARRVMIGPLRPEYAVGSYAPPSSEAPGEGERSSGPPASLGKFFTATIVSLALCEAAAVFGLVAALLTGDLVTQWGLTALSVAGMVGHFPRESTLRAMERAEEMEAGG